MRYVWSVLVAAPLIMSCAARSNAVPTAAAQAQADELVRQGCYDCLLVARAIYERMPPGVAGKLSIRRFETELLLASRDRERAFDPAATLTRARSIPAALGTAIDAARYVALVEATPPGRVGIPANRPL